MYYSVRRWAYDMVDLCYNTLGVLLPSRDVSGLCYLLLSPSQELLFSGESNSDIICTLTLTNISKNTVAYKVRRVGEEVAQVYLPLYKHGEEYGQSG